jgi:phosphate uptake regulator
MAGFFQKLLNPQDTIDQCRVETLEGLHMSQLMYAQVLEALHDQTTEQVKSRMKQMDLEVNRLQRSVRQKIYRHLSLNEGKDLLSGIQLHDIVNEIERVGDYSKNIAELVDMLSGPVDWGEREQGMRAAHRDVLKMFDETFACIEKGDRNAGRRCDELYGSVARYCDALLEEIVGEESEDAENVARSLLSLVLMLRYTKRVAAHLRNAVLTITNPYHRLGYSG